MTFWKLVRRNLRFHARAHIGVLLGAIIGSAALTGALLVGDSVRESLKTRALQRLAGAWFAMAPGDRFFEADFFNDGRWNRSIESARFSSIMASVVASARARRSGSGGRVPSTPAWLYRSAAPTNASLLALVGTASLPSAEARANQVQVFGVSEQFWMLAGQPRYQSLAPDSVVLNQGLALQLRAKIGDDIILRVQPVGRLSTDAALSPRRDQSQSLRLRVAEILDANSGGDLDMYSRGTPPLNAFVSGEELGNRLKFPGKANLLLSRGIEEQNPPTHWLSRQWFKIQGLWTRLIFKKNYDIPTRPMSVADSLQLLNMAVKHNWKLEDASLTVDYVTNWSGVELRSSRVFLDPPAVEAARQFPSTNRIELLTYLANLIRAGSNSTPYSMVTAAGPPYTPSDLRDDEIVISQWLAEDLQAKPGEFIDLVSFLPESGANLLEATNRFRIHSIVPPEFPWADRTLMPDFPGIENAETAHDWDAGFPLVHEIRPKDEQYWKDFRGTPKAFITLAAGQKMWTTRFGSLTSMRFPTPPGMSTGEMWYRVKKNLLANLDPAQFGLRFEPVREQALKAATQAQDFGQLFLGFSIFLVVAALLLMGLLFQFGLEQRAGEIGTLLALGFVPKQVRRLFLVEGIALALIGGVLGALGGIAYARAMLWALHTIWREATANATLEFHAGAISLIIGIFASTVIATFTIWLTLRRQARQPARELLAGAGAAPLASTKTRSRGRWLALGAGLAACALVGWAIISRDTANAGIFFGAGAMVLVAGLALGSAWMTLLASRSQATHFNLANLGVRGVSRRPRRSLTTLALLACGSFVIIAIGVFRLDAQRDAVQPTSGTGGFALLGQCGIPVAQDLNTAAGRDFFGLNEQDLAGVKVTSFRVREGDEASCLNLNRAQKPRLLGVDPRAMAGRFTFAKVAKGFDPKRGWEALLSRPAPVDTGTNAVAVIPAIGDANSIQWALGKKIGDTLDYVDEQGRPFKIQLVGGLANSVLQGNLLIDQARFVERFPGAAGYRLFLIDAPSNTVSEVSATLSRALQDVGLELTSTVQRLNAFNAVQNTYLGTFQVLGGIGLLLGSAGLGIVVLRNVFERRGELALLTAVGFRRRALRRLLLSEHGALLGLGLGLGIVSAAVAVLPALLTPGTQLPYASLAITLGAVLFNGMVWTLAAIRVALRGNLLDALRNE